MSHIKRCAAVLLTVSMLFGPLSSAAGAAPTFADVPTTHWAFSSIEQAAAEGIVEGIGNNKFNPSGTITYAEFCTMIARVFRASELALQMTDYDSSTDKWWEPYVESVRSGGLLTGTAIYDLEAGHMDIQFELVETGIPRYDMAMTMYQLVYYEYPGISAPIPTESELNAAKAKIADWSNIPEKYQKAVATCYAAGYLTGTDSKGTFNGTATMTRAEAATVMCRLTDKNVSNPNPGPTTPPEETPSTPPSTVTGNKDSEGHTTAASVNNIQNRNKSDKYPTTGNSETVSNNGYYTGANIDIGSAVLVYDFLDWVNEARRAEGLHELEWVPSDAAEEYTLVRAHDLRKHFSHDRADGIFATEVIAWGAGDAKGMFTSWMESEGHRKTLLSDSRYYMCAARDGANWIITTWTEYAIDSVNNHSEENYTKEVTVIN